MSSENRSNIEESAADENTIINNRKERTLMNPEKLEIMKSMIRRGANTREIALDLNISQASTRRYGNILLPLNASSAQCKFRSIHVPRSTSSAHRKYRSTNKNG
ncbi:hypothetical protein RF11_13748 [Thelohanellus kitauei]|uniref:Uncharacterized protein n=1 Tax=Thelohanellus kitauei TaxID=669202 RepID=A0A0C2ME92_THEKT|nr:hypothetical protein RF11_13748 [Thelohanellus kitauei]